MPFYDIRYDRLWKESKKRAKAEDKGDNINKKTEYKWGDQMEAAQRIRLIRIIEKMEKNPAFSNKLGIKNTSEYLAEKEQKK